MQVHASSNPAGVSGGRRPDKKNPQHDSVRDAHALAKKRRWTRIVACSTGISSKPVAALHSAVRNLGATRYKSDDFLKSRLLLPIGSKNPINLH